MADTDEAEQDAPEGLQKAETAPETPLADEPQPSTAKNVSAELRQKADAQDLTSRLLHLLSTASNEMIIGIAAGLAICTYLVLGRVGLLLIGVFVGIVLHAAWEGHNRSKDGIRGEQGVDLVKRLLDLRQVQTEATTAEAGSPTRESDIFAISLDDFPPNTKAALNELTETILKDYVNWWYNPILPDEQTFPSACRQTLVHFIHSVSLHLSRKRPADTFLDFLTNSSSIVIVFLNELSSALLASQGLRASPKEAIQEYLVSSPESSLANVLNQNQQKKKFHIIAEDILQNFLERKAYECGPLRAFLREILAGVILEMSLQAISRPEWLNGWIVYALEGSEPEFIQAIDEGMSMTSQDNAAHEDAIDGQMKSTKKEGITSQKRLSKADQAMEEAMEEAKRLTKLMAEEDMKRQDGIQDQSEPHTAEMISDTSKSNGEMLPPVSAQGDGGNNRDLGHTTLQDESDALFKDSEETMQEPFPPILDEPVPQPIISQEEHHRDHKSSITFTLHNASINILDDSAPGDKGRLRNKPTGDYLVQIEPQSSHHPGWMIMRKYSDFENLHEIIRRIAAISGVAAFTEQHNSLPNWKNYSKASLRAELERYLKDACRYQLLAESEGMKRFLERESSNSPGKGNFGWPSPTAFENMGKGMLDVLANAPKGAAEGGKVVLGGVTGVLGNISRGQKKKDSTTSLGSVLMDQSSHPISTAAESSSSLTESPLHALDEHSKSVSSSTPQTTGFSSLDQDRIDFPFSEPEASIGNGLPTANHHVAPQDPTAVDVATADRPEKVKQVLLESHVDLDHILLPPPPSEISDDYDSHNSTSAKGVSARDSTTTATRSSVSSEPSLQYSGRIPTPNLAGGDASKAPFTYRLPRKESAPLSEQETRVAVELLFAVINELYMLSSVWNIRRTLLTAAKTFLLRPGNPSLLSIRDLIQDSVITDNISDEGIANHIRKLRENSMPTEEELKTWPPELTADGKEKLRVKARKLLLEKGMPPALMGVMGQAATNEALGRVFDCLQVEEVTRGLMFGLLLQGVRAVTQ